MLVRAVQIKFTSNKITLILTSKIERVSHLNNNILKVKFYNFVSILRLPVLPNWTTRLPFSTCPPGPPHINKQNTWSCFNETMKSLYHIISYQSSHVYIICIIMYRGKIYKHLPNTLHKHLMPMRWKKRLNRPEGNCWKGNQISIKCSIAPNKDADDLFHTGVWKNYQPKQCRIQWTSLKFTIHLDCLIPLQIGNSMIPVIHDMNRSIVL